MGQALLLLLLAPLLLGLATGAAARWVARVPDRPRRGGSPSDDVERVLRVAAGLRRLERELAALHATDSRLPGKYQRLTAVSRAYEETLLSGCRLLGIPLPVERAPIPPVERLAVEAALARAGVRW